MSKLKSTVEDKLYLDRFKPDSESHLYVMDPQVCIDKCPDKLCTVFCPANVYEWDEDNNDMIVGYEGCLECGTCRIGCPYDNILWLYPKGGYGVQHRYG